jgi:hypothetical protein
MLHVVILKLIHGREGVSKSMVYAFSLQEDANNYAAFWNQKVGVAREADKMATKDGILKTHSTMERGPIGITKKAT